MIEVLGIEVPDAGPVFLAALAMHVVAGLVCVVSGGVAALSHKGGGRHIRWGRVYLCGLGVVFVTMAVMVALRWPHSAHLLAIGCVAGAAGLVGLLDRRRGRHRDSLHLVAMGVSYIALLTGFYVDNGASLPVWDRLPMWAYWLLPSLVGSPVIACALLRRQRRRPSTRSDAEEGHAGAPPPPACRRE